MLIFIGLAIYVIGAIGLLIDEFKESIIWGTGGSLLPVAACIVRAFAFSGMQKEPGADADRFPVDCRRCRHWSLIFITYL